MAPADPRQTKFVLDESRIPRAWYNIAADLPVAAVPAAPSGHPPADRPGRPRAALPDGADRPGGLAPSARSRSRSRSATPTGCTGRARSTARTGSSAALDTPAHIYYKYEGGSPAGSHKPNTAIAAGLLQQGGGRQAARDRDRRRPVGERAGLRRRPVRPRGQGLHGPRELRPEAVPPDPHGDLRRRGRGQPVARRRTTAARSSPRRPTARARSGMAISEAVEDAATRDDTKYALGSVLNHVLLHQTVDRPGGDRADGDGRRGARRRHRLHRRRLELRRAGVPVPRPEVPRRRQAPDHRGRARGGPEPDPRRLRLRLRRHRQDGAARQDAHARLTTSSPSRSTPAACATTGWRRWSACSRSTACIEARSVHQRRDASRRASSSPGPRASCRRPSRPTRSSVAIDEALAAKEAGEARVILFNLCGHGHFDLSAYERYLDGSLEDYEYPLEKVEAALAGLPKV